MFKGIDISNYQRNEYKYLIDKYGQDFVICRAAWRYWVDPMCDVMYQYAKSKGKKLGVYFFPLTSDGDPEKHAAWSVGIVKGYLNEAVFFLDWESYNGKEGKNDPSQVAWAKRWLDKFYELTGVRPMIYMNSNCNSLYNFTEIAKGNYGLWIANYGRNNGVDNGRPKVKYWDFAAIHQFTSLGNEGRSLDRDTFYGDQAAWDRYAKSDRSFGETPAQPAKTYTEEEVKQILNQERIKAQAEIDEAIKKQRAAEEKLGTCEKTVKEAKEGLEAIKNYE